MEASGQRGKDGMREGMNAERGSTACTPLVCRRYGIEVEHWICRRKGKQGEWRKAGTKEWRERETTQHR
jgi:hypothetical protein